MNLAGGTGQQGGRLDHLLAREWLCVNHIGGYAASTVPSLNTRKYHGLLVAAMAPPVRRMVLLSRVEETIHCDGWPTPLACNEYPGTIHPVGHESLRAFENSPFPRWAYQGEGWSLEKSLQLLRGENTVVLTYTLVGAKKPVELELRPLLAMRSIHELRYQWGGQQEAVEKALGEKGGHHRVPPTSRTPEVFFAHDGGHGGFEAKGDWYFNTIYRCEQERGYPGLEDLWCPGAVKWKLSPGKSVHFVCSADPIELERAIAAAELECAQLDVPIVDTPVALRDTDHDLLVRAAKQFVLELPEDNGSPCRVMTKFPWAAPSVRDGLIALPGVLLVTGKFAAAKAMLLGLASRVRDGLVPTEFPEDGGAAKYDGVEASLWFVNAVWQYVRYSGEEPIIAKLRDAIGQIVRRQFPEDSTCALVALRYNAVRIAAQWLASPKLDALAGKIQESFNRRYWNEAAQCCYDRIGDASVRANQLLAISLPFAVLAPQRHAVVLERVGRELLTPLGLRTLAPGESGYCGRYGGDAASRDRACANGSVHPWLLGPFVSAYVRVHGRGDASVKFARDVVEGCLAHMRDEGVGQLCELFNGDPSHRPGGAIACAAGVGELLRCYVEDILNQRPAAGTLSPTEKTAELPVSVAPKVATKR